MAVIERRGGKAGRRTPSFDEARRMVAIRETRRAFRKFYAQCFWLSSPDLRIDMANAA